MTPAKNHDFRREIMLGWCSYSQNRWGTCVEYPGRVWTPYGKYNSRKSLKTIEILWIFDIFLNFGLNPKSGSASVRSSNGCISELRRSCGVNRSINIPQKCTTYWSRTPRTLKKHFKTIFASSSFFFPICQMGGTHLVKCSEKECQLWNYCDLVSSSFFHKITWGSESNLLKDFCLIRVL